MIPDISHEKGPLRVDSPLYFVYRSPSQKRKLSSSVLKIQEKNDKMTTASSNRNKGTNAVSNKHSEQPAGGKNKLIEKTNTSSDVSTKEVMPRELIEARSAFKTIKNYCNNLIRGSANNVTSNRGENDNRKSMMPLNFFAKPVVDRPISIP